MLEEAKKFFNDFAEALISDISQAGDDNIESIVKEELHIDFGVIMVEKWADCWVKEGNKRRLWVVRKNCCGSMKVPDVTDDGRWVGNNHWNEEHGGWW